jgi:hypothetical protein
MKWKLFEFCVVAMVVVAIVYVVVVVFSEYQFGFLSS